MLLVSAILFLNSALTCCHIPGTNIEDWGKDEAGASSSWPEGLGWPLTHSLLPPSYPESAADAGNEGILNCFSVRPPINTTIRDNFLISHLAIIIALAFHSCDSIPLHPGPTGQWKGTRPPGAPWLPRMTPCFPGGAVKPSEWEDSVKFDNITKRELSGMSLAEDSPSLLSTYCFI